MPRLFHLNACVRLRLEWLISMHHTLDSSAPRHITAFCSCFLSRIRVNDGVLFAKHYVKLSLHKKCHITVFKDSSAFLNSSASRPVLQPFSGPSFKAGPSQGVTRSHCSLTPRYFTMNPGGALCQRARLP